MDDRGPPERPLAVVLAGGLSRRMDAPDKPLRRLGDKPIIAHILDRLAADVAGCALNVNGDPSRYGAFGLPILADPLPGFLGPLVGMLAALVWAAKAGHAHVLTVPGDTPFVPTDLATRLAAAVRAGAPAAVAGSGARRHPVAGLWPVAAADRLRQAISDEGLRRVEAWADHERAVTVVFEGDGYDPFFNVNTPDDLRAAERLFLRDR